MQTAVRQAMGRGLEFLCGSQSRSGLWSDFDTLAGASTEWVTGYVGWTLAGLDVPEARAAARRSWHVLRRRWRPSGGWGYSRRVPVDADSTSWVLALAQRLEARDDKTARRGLAALDAHAGADGGVSTYRAEGPIRRFTGLFDVGSFAGWCSPHTCVTAAAALVEGWPRLTAAQEYLRRAQRADGTWVAYWWPGWQYPTALAVSALVQAADPRDAGRVRRALSTTSARLGVDGAMATPALPLGSPFATASALWILTALRPGQATVDRRIDGLVDWLVTAQDVDGGWRSSALMRIPPPACADPEGYEPWVAAGRGGGSLVVDQRRLFTTATVVEGLARYVAGHVRTPLDAP
jgi:hypothetical protein